MPSTPYRTRVISSVVTSQGKTIETTPKADAMQLVNGRRTDVDEATQTARSCPLFAAGGYLSPLITFSATSTRVDHALNRVPEGAIIAILMDSPVELYITDMDDKRLLIGNFSGFVCRARYWIF